jgi:hypothetical protein
VWVSSSVSVLEISRITPWIIVVLSSAVSVHTGTHVFIVGFIDVLVFGDAFFVRAVLAVKFSPSIVAERVGPRLFAVRAGKELI